MNIINRGTWSAYTPDPLPSGLPPHTSFAKRDSDGLDWYAALYGKTPLLGASTVKVVAWKEPNGDWRTQAVSKDATMLFPVNGLLLEVLDYAGTNPIADLSQKKYDEANNAIVPFPAPAAAPVTSVTPRQARLALLNAGLLDQVTAAVNAAGGATLITWEYASVFLRTDPLITQIATSLNLTSNQIDALFAAAAVL